MYVDLDTSTATASSHPPKKEEQLSLDPPEEDDEMMRKSWWKNEQQQRAQVAQGQLDNEAIPIDQCELDGAEEQLIQQV